MSRTEGLVWIANLDAIEKHFDQILDWPDSLNGRQFSRPSIFLEGEHSTFVGPEHEEVIQHFFPSAHRQVIENAGHWVHVENTEAFLQAVRAFVGFIMMLIELERAGGLPAHGFPGHWM